MDKSKIKEFFSKVAPQYDDFAHPQKGWAKYLISKISKINNGNSPGHILDIGMGTGYLTFSLAKLFPEAMLFGCDIAQGMVAHAKGKAEREGFDKVKFSEADFEYLPYPDHYFDLVVSNAAFQWALDIKKALSEAIRVLRKGGDICLTLLGKSSLRELREVLKRVDINSSSTHKFILRETIELFMEKKSWEKFAIETKVEKILFNDIISCLKWLKAIGTNHGIKLNKNGLALGRQILALRKQERETFCLTFEVFYVWGEGKL